MSDAASPGQPADANLRETLDHCRVIIERSPVILFRRSPAPDYRLVFVSENIARFGYAAQELLSGAVAFVDLVHPDDRQRLQAEIEEFEKAGMSDYVQSYRILTRDGQVRWVEDTTTTERDAAGRIVAYQGVVADVTERRTAEEELRRSEEKFRRIIETAAEGFVMLDADFRILDVNEAYCRMLGYERQELLGASPMDYFTEKYRSYVQANRERMMQNPTRVVEGAYYRKDGRVVPVLIHGNTLTDAGGNFLGNVGFVTDLTEQKRSLFLAGEVLRSLQPTSSPAIPGLEVAGRNVSWEEIGGDYFDYLDASRDSLGRLLVTVGDISGHGVDSALLMTTARAVVREHAQRFSTLSEALTESNAVLYGDFAATGRFMTMFLLRVDAVDGGGELSWVRAGHDPALAYLPAEDRFVNLEGKGLPLGIVDGLRYLPDNRLRLPRPCVIALGTDGIWESRNLAGDMFGKPRFRELLRANAHRPAAEIVDAVFAEVFRHTAGVKLQDDVTLVLVKLV